MNYNLVRDVLDRLNEFETTATSKYSKNLLGFEQWISDQNIANDVKVSEPTWEGKENGRSAESVISTSLVHLNKFAKNYSKSAIQDSQFSTQDDFIYLITIKAFGPMTKMELIKKNVQEKPAGIQIINRLIKHSWLQQKTSKSDKRSKVLEITKLGLKALEQNMDKIRLASKIVTGNLNHSEQMHLIQLLQKLSHFHQEIFDRNIDQSSLLEVVEESYLNNKN